MRSRLKIPQVDEAVEGTLESVPGRANRRPVPRWAWQAASVKFVTWNMRWVQHRRFHEAAWAHADSHRVFSRRDTTLDDAATLPDGRGSGVSSAILRG